MGYRLEKLKDLFFQREVRMEVQMAEVNAQIHVLGAMARGENRSLIHPLLT